MADSNTTTYSFTLPEVGASADSWGTKLNANWDKVDDLLDGSIAVNGITVTGGSIDGTPVGATTPSTGAFTTVTTTGNVDVTGTVTADSLTIDGGGTIEVGSGGFNGTLNFPYSGRVNIDSDNNGTGEKFTIGNNQTGDGATNQIAVFRESGNVEFYEDTGTTAKFVWDSSAERLGIGESSPATDLHIKNSSSTQLLLESGNTSQGILLFGDAQDLNVGSVSYDHSDNSMRFETNDTERMRIDSSGNVGIGTNSPSETLHVNGSARFGYNEGAETDVINWVKGSNNALVFSSTSNPDYADGSWGGLQFHSANGYGGQLAGIAVSHRYGDATERQYADGMSFLLKNGGSADNWVEAMALRSSGYVGIGTYNPASKLHVRGPGNPTLTIDGSDGAYTSFLTMKAAGAGASVIRAEGGTNSLVLQTNGDNERARIDSSGNLLVGKTSANIATSGTALRGSMSSIFTVDGTLDDQVAIFNRTSSDGDILRFDKDGSTVGSIGTRSGLLQIGKGDIGLEFHDSDNTIYPAHITNNTLTDNTANLGSSFFRFANIYAANGTIQTSDRNEKQDIEVLSEAEQRVAQACKGLLRKFRWQDAVEEKGDDARIHFGIIAQDLQDAFTAEGLDAGRYAMFISTTWTDEETGEERTRLGVRYSELLAFIISVL